MSRIFYAPNAARWRGSSSSRVRGVSARWRCTNRDEAIEAPPGGVNRAVRDVVAVAGPLVVPALNPTIFVASALTLLWVTFVGIDLLRLARGDTLTAT